MVKLIVFSNGLIRVLIIYFAYPKNVNRFKTNSIIKTYL